MFVAALPGSIKFIIGFLFVFYGDSVKVAKVIRGEVTIGSSRWQVSMSKASSMVVGGNQLNVPYSFRGRQPFVPIQLGSMKWFQCLFDSPLKVLCNNLLYLRIAWSSIASLLMPE